MITLRDGLIKDSKFLFEMSQNKEFQKYYLSQLIYKNINEVKREIKDFKKLSKKNQGFLFIIENNKKPVGVFYTWKINKKHKRTSIGYGIKKEFWNKKIATKACKLALKFIQNELNLHSVEATTHPKNIASGKVLEKNGFKKIGKIKDYYYSNGQYIDRLLYWKVFE